MTLTYSLFLHVNKKKYLKKYLKVSVSSDFGNKIPPFPPKKMSDLKSSNLINLDKKYFYRFKTVSYIFLKA